MESDQIVHHLRLKYCRILNKQQLSHAILGDRFDLKENEQFTPSEGNEHVIIQKNELYDGKSIELEFRELINNQIETKVVRSSYRFQQLSDQFSSANQYDNKKIYFYCYGLQLFPQLTLQDYGIQSKDCIDYQVFSIDKETTDIQILIQIDNSYQIFRVNPQSQTLDLQELLCKQNNKTKDNYFLFLQTQRLNPQLTYQQLTIKDGYILKFAQLYKTEEKAEKYLEICIQSKDKIIHIEVPQEWNTSQIMKYFFNTENNLIYHEKQLDRDLQLCQQGIDNGDLLELQFPEKLEILSHSEYVKSNIKSDQQPQINITDEVAKEQVQQQIQQQQILLEEAKPKFMKKEFIELKPTVQEDFKVIKKPGLVVQFRCKKQDCPTKGSRQYLDLGCGNYDLSHALKLKCRGCNNDHNLEEQKCFAWKAKYQLFNGQQQIEKGILSNQLQEICQAQIDNHTLIIEKLN